MRELGKFSKNAFYTLEIMLKSLNLSGNLYHYGFSLERYQVFFLGNVEINYKNKSI